MLSATVFLSLSLLRDPVLPRRGGPVRHFLARGFFRFPIRAATQRCIRSNPSPFLRADVRFFEKRA
jgi:hypothetical protein